MSPSPMMIKVQQTDQDTVDRKNIFPVPIGLTAVWSGLDGLRGSSADLQ
jgi:hypothetical protein